MNVSSAYADLGGGLATAAEAGPTSAAVSPPLPRQARPRDVRHADTRSTARPSGVCAEHMFDPVSGWCGCGIRVDGKLAEGSPAWRAALERRMPTAERNA